MALVKEKNDSALLRKLIPLATLSQSRFDELCDTVVVEEGKKGTVLFEQGDSKREFVYLLQGKVSLMAGGVEMDRVEANSEAARFAMAHQIPRKVSAVAKTAVRFVRVDADFVNAPEKNETSSGSVYQVSDIPEESSGDWMTTMLQSPVFQRIPAANLQKVMISLEEIEHKKGDVVIRQGDKGDFYYIIKAGGCLLMRQPALGAKQIKLGELGPSDNFGEDALISDGERSVSVIMKTDGVLLRLGKKDFLKLVKEPIIRFLPFEKARQEVEGGANFLDARTPEQFKQKSLPGSQNLPFFSFRAKANLLDKHQKQIVICDDGKLSEAAAFLLIRFGFNAEVLKGGLNAVSSDHFDGGVDVEVRPAPALEIVEPPAKENSDTASLRRAEDEKNQRLKAEEASGKLRAELQFEREKQTVLKSELEQLNKALDKKSADLKALQQEQQLLSARQPELNGRLETLEIAVKQGEEALRGKEDSLQKLRGQLAEKERSIELLRGEQQSVKSTTGEQARELARLEDELDQAKQELETALKEKERQIQAKESEQQRQQAEMERELSAREEQLQSRQQELAETKNRLQALEDQIVALEGSHGNRLKDAGERERQLLEEKNGLLADLRQREESLEAHRQEKEADRQKLLAMEKELTDKQSDLSMLQQTVDSAHEEIEKLTGSNVEQKGLIEKSESELKELGEKLDRLQREKERLGSSLKNSEIATDQRVEELQQELERLNAREVVLAEESKTAIEEAENGLKALQEKLEAESREKVRLAGLLESEKSEKEAFRADARSDDEERQREIAELQQQLEQKQTEIEQNQTELEQLGHSRDELSRKVEEQQQQLSTAESGLIGHDEKLKELESEKVELNHQLQEASEQKARLEGSVVESEEARRAALSGQEEAEQRLVLLQAELDQLNSGFKDRETVLAEAKEALQKELETARQQHQQFDIEKRELEQRLAEQESSHLCKLEELKTESQEALEQIESRLQEQSDNRDKLEVSLKQAVESQAASDTRIRELEEEKEKLTAEVEALQNKAANLGEAQQNVSQLQASLDEVRGELEQSAAKLEQKEQVLTERESALEALSTERDALGETLRAELEDERRQLEEARDSAVIAEQNVTSLKQEKESLGSEIETLKSRVEQLGLAEQKTVELQEALDAARLELEQNRRLQEEQQQALEEKEVALQAATSEHASKQAEIEAELGAQKESFSELEATLQETQKENSRQGFELEERSARLKEADERLAELEEKVLESDKLAESREEELRFNEASYSEKLTELEASESELKDQIAVLTAETEELGNRLEQKEKNLQEQEEKVFSLRKENAVMGRRMQELKSGESELWPDDDEVITLREEVAHLADEKEQAAKEKARIKDQLQQLTEQNEELKEVVQEFMEAAEAQKEEVPETDLLKQEIEMIREQAAADVGGIGKQLEAAKKEITELQEALEAERAHNRDAEQTGSLFADAEAVEGDIFSIIDQSSESQAAPKGATTPARPSQKRWVASVVIVVLMVAVAALALFTDEGRSLLGLENGEKSGQPGLSETYTPPPVSENSRSDISGGKKGNGQEFGSLLEKVAPETGSDSLEIQEDKAEVLEESAIEEGGDELLLEGEEELIF